MSPPCYISLCQVSLFAFNWYKTFFDNFTGTEILNTVTPAITLSSGSIFWNRLIGDARYGIR